MKKEIFIIFLVAFVAISCNRKLIPGLNPGKKPGTFDEATYNYVYAEALRQKYTGNGTEAIAYFQKCLELNPESDAASFQIAQIVLSNGDRRNGKKYLQQAVNIRPGNYWYHMMLAGIYYQESNLDSAIICYETAAKIFPDKENLQLNLANLYTESKQTNKAREILEKFDEKYGINDNTTVSLIKNLVAGGEYGKALVKIEDLLKSDSDNLVYNELLADVYRRRGQKDEAIDVYIRLIERNPENTQIQLSLCFFLNEEKNYEELLMLTETVILNSDISREEKITLFGTLIENDDLLESFSAKLELNLMLLEANYENDDLVLLLRPEMLQKTGRIADATALLEKIIKTRPDNYYAWERLLLAYYEMRDFKKLMERGEECATRFNRSFLAKMLFATGAAENKRFDTALEELRKANILAGDNKDLMLQVLSIRADVYYRMKNYDRSFASFSEALEINSDDLTILNNYAYFLAEQNTRLKEAELMARKVIEKEESNNTFLDTYAWVLYKRGKTREAAKIMEKIIKSGEKDDAEWYEHYGFILKKLGKCREAVQKWERAMELDQTKEELKKEIENCRKGR